MRTKKFLAIAVAAAMTATMLAACGGGDNASSAASKAESQVEAAVEEAVEEAVAEEVVNEAVEAASAEESAAEAVEDAATAVAAAAEGFTPVAVPEVPDLGGMTSNEWLLDVMKTDSVPLSGIQADHQEHRDSVYKGLDKVDLEDTDIQVAFLGASAGTIFFTTMQDYAQQLCDEYGFTMTLFDANFDLTKQMEQYDSVLNGDYDWIVCNAVDIHALSEYYAKSADKGMPVFVNGPTAAHDDYQIITTCLAGSWMAGFGVGQYVCEELWGQYPEGLKWGTLIDKLGDADSESRPNGFIAGYLYKYAELAGTPYDSEYDAGVIAYNTWVEARNNGSASIPGIMDLVGYVTANNIATSAAAPAAAELLTAHPDMDLAFCETDSFSSAIVTEIQQRGLIPGEDILVAYGADGTAEICQLIKEGLVMAIGTNVPYAYVQGIFDMIKGVYDGTFSIDDANDIVANAYLPTYVVSSENIDEVWTEGQPYADGATGYKIETVTEFNERNGTE
jgi:ribose transport system substrate-binding protein